MQLTGSIADYILCYVCSQPPSFGYDNGRGYSLSSLCSAYQGPYFHVVHGVVRPSRWYLDLLRLATVQATYNCIANSLSQGSYTDVYTCAKQSVEDSYKQLTRVANNFANSFKKKPIVPVMPKFDYRRVISTLMKYGLLSRDFELRGKYIQIVFFKKTYKKLPKDMSKQAPETIVIELSMIVPVPLTFTRDDLWCVNDESLIIDNANKMCERAVAKYMNGWTFTLKSFLLDLCGPCNEMTPTFDIWVPTWDSSEGETQCGYSELDISRASTMGIDISRYWCNETSFVNDVDNSNIIYVAEVTKYKHGIPHSRYVYSYCQKTSLAEINDTIGLY